MNTHRRIEDGQQEGALGMSRNEHIAGLLVVLVVLAVLCVACAAVGISPAFGFWAVVIPAVLHQIGKRTGGTRVRLPRLKTPNAHPPRPPVGQDQGRRPRRRAVPALRDRHPR